MAETTTIATPLLAPLPRTAAMAPRTLYIVAWALCLFFYFLQYAIRSAPGVMIPELTAAFGLTTLGVSALLGMYYYTYAGFALISGASLDRFGAKLPIFVGLLATAAGSVLFGMGTILSAEGGRLLQGAGSAFAFTGAVYLAVHGFSAKWLATAVGFTQLAGMLGGFAGQLAVGPLVQGPIAWQSFWFYAGAALAVVAVLMLIATPAAHEPAKGSIWTMFAPYRVVLANPQSWLCGIIGGLLFMPTTIGDMIWGVPFLHLGGGIPTAEAVTRASMVPLGWVIGAPLLGYVADRMGRRKPALYSGIALMLLSGIGIAYFGHVVPPYLGGLFFGIGSGAAMIPYAMIKEANPDKVKGSATGAMNFLVFSCSALLAPAFGYVLMRLADGAPLSADTFAQANSIWLGAILVALLLTMVLHETGTKETQA
jgi:MFS family permease